MTRRIPDVVDPAAVARPPSGAAFERVLWRARQAAFPPGQFVGQEGFMSADEILFVAQMAGIAPGVRVLDLCCGVAGPGLFLTGILGCTYLGLDASPKAIAVARHRAHVAGLPAEFAVKRLPWVPPGQFDVVLFLETLLAFRDKQALLHEISSALSLGGRLAFTVEEGVALTEAERNAMPAADTVWLTPLPCLLRALERAQLRVRWIGDCSLSHLANVDALMDAYSAAAAELRQMPGPCPVDGLLDSHRLWSRWLRDGRVRKFAVVAERCRR